MSCECIRDEFPTQTKTPGVCLRCGREFDNPVPEITHPGGHPEIATSEWCADCNALTMSVMFRESSAYRVHPLRDPLRGGRKHAG